MGDNMLYTVVGAVAIPSRINDYRSDLTKCNMYLQ
jgi:hypothetical protein